MPFYPDTQFYICRVPWDNTYKHVRLYDDSDSQEADIKLLSITRVDYHQYTYIRWNNTIRVGDVEPEHLQYANYVMYRNGNSTDARWVYAFIVECNYLNDKVAELVIETDVWQTYMFDVDFTIPQFIVRQHTRNDDFYSNYEAEPDFPGQLWEYNSVSEIDQSDETDMFTPSMVVIATSADVEYYQGATGNEVRKVDLAGGIYNGIPSGLAYYAFHVDTPEWTAMQMVRDLNRAGAGDAIADIFMFPGIWISGVGNAGGAAYAANKVNYTGSAMHQYLSLTRPTTIDGTFTPFNNKTLHYPYNFLRIQATTGEFMDVEWELWSRGSETKQLVMSCAISPNAQGTIMLNGQYRGITRNPEKVLTFPVAIKVPWTYGSYANWSAQNKLSNVLQGVAGAAMLAIPGAAAVRAGGMALKAGLPYAAGALSSAGSGATAVGAVSGAAGVGKHFAGRALNAASTALAPNALTAGAGVASLASLQSNIYYQSHQANTVRGTVDSGDMFAAYGNKHYVDFKYVHLSSSAIRQVDHFFTVYGYAVNKIGQMNMTQRAYWNYVQTRDCSVRGKYVPSYAMDIIHSTLDSGVFFWHTTASFGTFFEYINTITS